MNWRWPVRHCQLSEYQQIWPGTCQIPAAALLDGLCGIGGCVGLCDNLAASPVATEHSGEDYDMDICVTCLPGT